MAWKKNRGKKVRLMSFFPRPLPLVLFGSEEFRNWQKFINSIFNAGCSLQVVRNYFTNFFFSNFFHSFWFFFSRNFSNYTFTESTSNDHFSSSTWSKKMNKPLNIIFSEPLATSSSRILPCEQENYNFIH